MVVLVLVMMTMMTMMTKMMTIIRMMMVVFALHAEAERAAEPEAWTVNSESGPPVPIARTRTCRCCETWVYPAGLRGGS